MHPEQEFIETSLELCQRGDMEELARVYLEILLRFEDTYRI